ncbi:BEN domain-containing protein 5 [Saguinus oedipus]|uniref:BEN domain-containing protein 5 n=1 Tax=Saguinus oedipus TaxID=9490 RepID=A0ABQ9VGD4_SAGOE|nr:BEN domain-containing protein 5 [Saguinus oedipus]
MYAFVRFLEDNVCYALPVSCVRDFSPRSRLDFDNQKVYAVYRGPEELGAGPESPPRAPNDWGALLLHKAQILALAGTVGSARGLGPREGPGTWTEGMGEPLLAPSFLLLRN